MQSSYVSFKNTVKLIITKLICLWIAYIFFHLYIVQYHVNWHLLIVLGIYVIWIGE